MGSLICAIKATAGIPRNFTRLARARARTTRYRTIVNAGNRELLTILGPNEKRKDSKASTGQIKITMENYDTKSFDRSIVSWEKLLEHDLFFCSLFRPENRIQSADAPCRVRSERPCPPSKFRTPSGTCNNVRHPAWGARGSPFLKLLPPAYSDGKNIHTHAIASSIFSQTVISNK